jgi:hypothetical protein
MAKRLLFAIVVILLLAACGNTSASSTSVSSASQAQAADSSSAPAQLSSAPAQTSAAPAAAPGCGTYCQQAGGSAGDEPSGYPCSPGGCLHCPPQNCISLGNGTATVTHGVAAVQMTCNLSAECRGAFLICLPGYFCHTGPSAQGTAAGRMAGSDFTVPAGATSDVPIGLTAVGEQVVSTSPGGFTGSLIVDMLNYGYVPPGPGSQLSSLTLTTADSPTYPAGATAGCGGAVFVGPDTSCAFARNVAKAYASSVMAGNGTVTASSPVTGESYEMRCTEGALVVCRGGTNAVVEFYT